MGGDSIKNFESTISSSKEESIAKAISLIQGEQSEKIPLVRPDISITKILFSFVLWLFIQGIFVFLCLYLSNAFHISNYVTHTVATCFCLLIIITKSNAFVRNVIFLYQRYAPEKMRRSCLFVPSCSEYMLLAIEKYGVVIGVCKGIGRLLRCHQPNGGEDYP